MGEGINMGFPSEKELKTMRTKLAKAEPSRLLPKNATKADRVKYQLCEKFVIYLSEHRISQVQLARKLKVDPSRINEIVKYRIDLYTVDKLMDLAERLDLDFDVKVA
jgi:predicted XRE-type DNA-binding protein